MSNQSSSSSNENKIDIEEISEFRRELRKEKDMLKDSQSQSFELIRGLEMHVKTLSESRIEDKRRILELERELKNCIQEIDYLQDQVNTRNTEVYNLQLKLADIENMGEEIVVLREQVKRSDFEKLVFINELEKKDGELNGSLRCIQKLEESISSIGLEYQCELESLKLDLMALEQNSFEANKTQEVTQENARMSELIKNLELQIHEAEKVIECLHTENKYFMERIESPIIKVFYKKVKELMVELETSEINEEVLYRKVKESLHDWQNGAVLYSNELAEDRRSCSNALAPALPKMVGPGELNADLKEQLDRMSSQIHDYELLVSQLKEELKREKIKAKDNTDDLAQEMAELRYHMTELLEEEHKRRACVEQVALQRIAELEAQLGREEAPSQEKKLIKQ
ncbi:actin or actin-binding cytoskeletal protein [Lithospermum erythrorhizon]|uniref:Actin or actin-binding cytoskeletal protein n=1 Tax=Lithospermum erythrorhizon TaxID=34254 RepID=A0AAV3QE77_LITER